MSIYTRRGDKGYTRLIGGLKVYPKDSLRVAAYGTLDELNSQVGVVLAFLGKKQKSLAGLLFEIQKDLFEIEAEVATKPGAKQPFVLKKDRLGFLEDTIDSVQAQLPPLTNFIYPQGSKSSAALHVARTVARRAERELVKLSRKEKVNPQVLAYINRLSDLLFVLARLANKLEGVEERVWKGKPVNHSVQGRRGQS